MIKIMVNGLPGNMGRLISKHFIPDSRFSFIPLSLTGPGIEEKSVKVLDIDIKLILPEDHAEVLENLKKDEGSFYIVDYTHPTAVNENAKLYVEKEVPFVMGTTGGDRKLLTDTVTGSNISAVIAPNMSGEVVAFTAMMEYMAKTFPGIFKNHELSIKESHQKGKADTSGTAKAMIRFFNEMGVDFTENDIVMVREPEEQLKMGISEEYLTGHGWHTYTLNRPDKSVVLEFSHNINGRDVYYPGTADAVLYLKSKMDLNKTGHVYSMLDVLKKS